VKWELISFAMSFVYPIALPKSRDFAMSIYGDKWLEFRKVRASNVFARGATLVVNVRQRFPVFLIVVPSMRVLACW